MSTAAAEAPTTTKLSQLDALKKFTKVVADTGDFETMRAYKPQDATTNPSLILQAATKPDYAYILDKVIADRKSSGLTGHAQIEDVIDHVLVAFGLEILKIVPGRVSTETDARLSFDTAGTIAKAHQLIGLYEKNGLSRDRVLIKIASTWEGIKAAEVLAREGIHCNLTLLFSLTQAIACAEAKVQLISPFVGRILDWFKASTKKDYAPTEDPGVLSVTEIFNYYKKFGYKTEVMGASFRNKGEITELAGCDLLTIAPKLLAELDSKEEDLPKKLDASKAAGMTIEKITIDKATFDKMHAEDRMAHDKLKEGIEGFSKALEDLEHLLANRLAEISQPVTA